MTRYRAAWVLPVTGPPSRDAWIDVADGRIVGLGTADASAGEVAAGTIELGQVAVMPALVNAHTHLELSYLHGAVRRSANLLDWVRELLRLRREQPDPAAPVILDATRRAIAEARAAGTGLVGDVSNGLTTVPLLAEAGMPARVFQELIGFSVADPVQLVREARRRCDGAGGLGGDVRLSLAPHAPYSVSPALFDAIRRDLDAAPDGVSSVHLGESPEELELLRHGTGAWRTFLETLGVWDAAWPVPGCGPVAYLEGCGFLDRRVLAVHGVQFTGEDLDRVRALGVTVAACPRSNRHVGVGSPPLEAFYAMQVRVAFGTDSLASAPDLNMFMELAEARRIAPRVPAAALLASGTIEGARALGFEREFGSIEPGKRAALLAVRLPAGVADVEEYLLSGIGPEAIEWLS